MPTRRDLRSPGRHYHWSKPSVWKHTGNRLWCVDCACDFYGEFASFRFAQARAASHTSGRPGDPRRSYTTCRVGNRWAERFLNTSSEHVRST